MLVNAYGPPRARDTILYGGLTAGVLDITDAVATSLLVGNGPVRMLQTIASGVLGPRSFEGGAATAALGLVLHFTIALGAATVFFLASRRLPFLIRRPVISGLIFGLCVFFFMNLVVQPLAGFSSLWVRVPAWPLLANQLAIHMLGVGLPIALFASRSARRSSAG